MTANPAVRRCASIVRIIGDGADTEDVIEAHYQPIVDLNDRCTVGFEALAREDGAFPAARFDEARQDGTLAELDTECQRAALDGARDLDTTLFVNVEPGCFDGPPADAPGPERVIVEVTERGLTARPAELLVALERVRERGWGVAVDDVGVDWRSLALLPFLAPDVIKLDRGVISEHADSSTARVVRSVRAHIERHGGRLLAEGIETVGHEDRARGYGATLGQGWHFGHPVPAPLAGSPRDLIAPYVPIEVATPFSMLGERLTTVGSKGDLLTLSLDLEREAVAMRDPAVVLATFQRAEHFSAATRTRYAELAKGAAFVAAFGTGLEPEPAPGVRGAALDVGEALEDEWTVIVVGPHSALALIARDLGDRGPDAARRFEYLLTEDRTTVMRAARALMRRVAAKPPPRPTFRANLATPPPAALGRPAPHRGVPASHAS